MARGDDGAGRVLGSGKYGLLHPRRVREGARLVVPLLLMDETARDGFGVILFLLLLSLGCLAAAALSMPAGTWAWVLGGG